MSNVPRKIQTAILVALLTTSVLTVLPVDFIAGSADASHGVGGTGCTTQSGSTAYGSYCLATITDVFDVYDSASATRARSAEYNANVALRIANGSAVGGYGSGTGGDVYLYSPSQVAAGQVGDINSTKYTDSKTMDGNGNGTFPSRAFSEVGTWIVLDYNQKHAAAFVVNAARTLVVSVLPTSLTYAQLGDSTLTITVADAAGTSLSEYNGVNVTISYVDGTGATVTTTVSTNDAGKSSWVKASSFIAAGAQNLNVTATQNTTGTSAAERTDWKLIPVNADVLSITDLTSGSTAKSGFSSNKTYNITYPGGSQGINWSKPTNITLTDGTNTYRTQNVTSSSFPITITNGTGTSVSSGSNVTFGLQTFGVVTNLNITSNWNRTGTWTLTVQQNFTGGTTDVNNGFEYTKAVTFTVESPAAVNVNVISPANATAAVGAPGTSANPQSTVAIGLQVLGSTETTFGGYTRLTTDNSGTSPRAITDVFTVTGDVLFPFNATQVAPSPTDNNATGNWTLTIAPTRGSGTITIGVKWGNNATVTKTISIATGGVITASVSEIKSDTPTDITFTLTDSTGTLLQGFGNVSLLRRDTGALVNGTTGNGTAGNGLNGQYLIRGINSTLANDHLIAVGQFTSGTQTYYSYAKILVSPGRDMSVAISPSASVAGESTVYTVNTTRTISGVATATAADVYFLNATAYASLTNNNTLPSAAIVSTPSSSNIGNTTTTATLAWGTYKVYTRTSDGKHDNLGSEPTVTVANATISCSPNVLDKGVDRNATITCTVTNPNGTLPNGTIAVVTGNTTEYYASWTNTSQTGGSLSPTTYTTGFSITPTTANITLPVVNGVFRMDRMNASGSLGTIYFAFKSGVSGSSYHNVTGNLPVKAPTVTITPTNIFVGESNIITVTVTRSVAGTPIEGANVTLTGGFGSAITDAAGQATFTVLPTGSTRIDVLVNGDSAGSFTPVGGLTLSFDKATYSPGDTVKVTVIQRGTTAGFVSGATVTVDGVVAGTTGNDGTLTFTALAAGNYTVNASKATFVGASKTLTVVTPVGPAAFTVTTLEVPATANLGDTVLVSAIVTNTGGQAGTFTCDLKVDGTTVDSKDVTVNAGSSKQCTFQFITTKEGALVVTISTASAKTMTVSKPTATFTYSGLTLSKTEVDAGAIVAVSAKVKNTGTASGTSSVALKVNGVTKQTQSVTLGAGEETTVGFDLQIAEKGTYSVTVGDQAATTLKVNEVKKPSTPGFEALAAIAAIGAAMLVIRRRRN
ncbi:MAG: PGF-CTERM sorting domain-containing protein [Euryarchaeota archaeon]|nr:PGF-CTERM sorting domain-containing protein [Euryarchaeota archaeon]